MYRSDWTHTNAERLREPLSKEKRKSNQKGGIKAVASVQLVVLHTQSKVDHDSRQQGNGQNGWSKPVIKTTLTSAPNTLCSPVEGDDGVNHGRHCDDGEEGSGYATDSVAKIEQADSQTAEDDGEIQPREERSLVGEEDFGLNASGKGDALACRRKM